MSLMGAGNAIIRGGKAREGREGEEDGWERQATCGPPQKLQLTPTKANLPGPFSGFQMTIPTAH
jgi:hypothetical protein